MNAGLAIMNFGTVFKLAFSSLLLWNVTLRYTRMNTQWIIFKCTSKRSHTSQPGSQLYWRVSGNSMNLAFLDESSWNTSSCCFCFRCELMTHIENSLQGECRELVYVVCRSLPWWQIFLENRPARQFLRRWNVGHWLMWRHKIKEVFIVPLIGCDWQGTSNKLFWKAGLLFVGQLTNKLSS